LRIAAFFLLLVAAARLYGQAWDRLGPEGGMVISMGKDSAGTLYLGTSDGHIFASEDRGRQWQLRGRVGTRTDAVISGLTADPRAAGKIYAAAWFREAGAGGGVFRSEDGGRSWAPSGLQGEMVRALELAASQTETMVAGTRSGVFRSRDAGKTWERISPPDDPELRNVDSIAIDPLQPDMIYAGTYHLPWKTSDGGITWKAIPAGLIDDSDIMSLLVDLSDPARVYLSACSGIYRSENRGELWTKLQGIPYAARRTQAIVQDPDKPAALYAATTEGLWVTRDAGESWERTTSKDWVVNAVMVLPSRGALVAAILIGTDAQGVLVSDDSGKNFVSANRGFTHGVVKVLVGDAGNAQHLLLLLERNGVELKESRDAGKNWSRLQDAPLAPAKTGAWNPDRIEHVYSSPWGWLAALTDGTLWIYVEQGNAWRRWDMSYTPPAKPATKRTAGSSFPKKRVAVYGGTLGFSAENAYLPAAEGLLRCDRAAKCALLNAFMRASRPSAIWVSSDGNALAVVNEGKLGLSQDAGQSAMWRGLPVVAQDTDWLFGESPQWTKLYLGTKRGLYFSPDEGESWSLVAAGLPAASIGPYLRTPTVFVVTLSQGGMYASPDGHGNWTRIDDDAERSRISGLVETQPGQILLGSQSEGILLWRRPARP
jgi:photosystem II stability/assembly factor-like uncharacterized protein